MSTRSSASGTGITYRDDPEIRARYKAMHDALINLNNAKREHEEATTRYHERIEELRGLPCPGSPDGHHRFHGFAEWEGTCEYCNLDGGAS